MTAQAKWLLLGIAAGVGLLMFALGAFNGRTDPADLPPSLKAVVDRDREPAPDDAPPTGTPGDPADGRDLRSFKSARGPDFDAGAEDPSVFRVPAPRSRTGMRTPAPSPIKPGRTTPVTQPTRTGRSPGRDSAADGFGNSSNVRGPVPGTTYTDVDDAADGPLAPAPARPSPDGQPDPTFGVVASAAPASAPAASTPPAARRPGLETTDRRMLELLTKADAAADYQETLVIAWETYNEMLALPGGLNGADTRRIKARINEVTDHLLFNCLPVQREEAMFARHNLRVGETLGAVARKYDLPWELVARMNRVDPSRLQAGRPLRVLKGPLHVVVLKSLYEVDVLLDGKVVRAYACGHGKDNCTPVGQWLVTKRMKNPDYTHPHTGQRFAGGDPKNPVGTRYMALQGMDARTRPLQGFAIHGTIEPDSIGTQSSLGCVRLGKGDIEELYELLTPGGSKVDIRE